MQAAKAKAVVWDPAPRSSKFLVGGGAELRMYEWEQSSKDGSSRFNTLSVCTELGQMRTFAWSPSTIYPDLVGVGLTTGRTLLLRMDASASLASSQVNDPSSVNKVSAVQINVRHSRPCNVVTFCPEQPAILAIGLEKGRGESLLVFDIETSAQKLDSGRRSSEPGPKPFALRRNSSTQPSRTHSPATSPQASEPHPLLQFGSSETVTSAAFLVAGPSNTSPLLVAALAGKWLRAHDLRTPPATLSTWGTRSIYGISPNPFNGQQFASYGDDGVVKVWDLRKSMDPLLSFSEVDAGAVPLRPRSAAMAKPLTELAWSPTKRGLMTTLEKESHMLRVWDIADGPEAVAVDDSGNDPTARQRAGSQPQSPMQDNLRLPVVLGDRRPRSFQLPLVSFAFAQSPLETSSTHFIGVSRDVSNPGSSGHRLEVIELHSARNCAFFEKGLVTSNASYPMGIETLFVRQSISSPTKEDTTGRPELSSRENSSPGVNLDRGRSFSFQSLLSTADRNKTPKPSGSTQPQRRVDQHTSDSDLEHTQGLNSLLTDPSFVLRELLELGYGADAAVNSNLVEGTLSEFWRYRGVISILSGFSAASSTSSTPTGTSYSSTNHPRSIYSDVSRSLRQGDEVRAKDAAYSAAATTLVSRRQLEKIFIPSSSQILAQRKLALQSCGVDWEDSVDVVCQRFQRSDNFEGAARHAFLSGHLEKAMTLLRSCKDERLRLLAPVLAAYIAQKNSGRGSDSVFADLCRNLSSDGDTPWVRAMFAMLASGGDWRELVDESGLPLKDRVAVAVRFLSDNELLPFLQGLGSEAIASGDPEAIVLFGLRDSGLNLLGNYINRTGDIQTAAIACSFVSPGVIIKDRRVERWIESYRTMLDMMRLYTARAVFDNARGRRGRIAMAQVRASGRETEANEISMAMRNATPPQLLVRCQFCSVTISPFSSNSSERNTGSTSGKRTTQCPSCSKFLPSCCVCLTKPEIHGFAYPLSSNLCWCQKCRHGGHAEHILEWFEKSRVCPVADCDCQCRTSNR